MWLAVIGRALLDADYPDANSPDRKAARRWFENGGTGLRRACTLAGVNPEVLQTRWEQAAQALRSRAKGRK